MQSNNIAEVSEKTEIIRSVLLAKPFRIVKITSLDLHGRYKPNVLRMLFDALIQNSTLTHLDISSTFLGAEGSEGVELLCSLLKQNKTLRSLIIDRNLIGSQKSNADLVLRALATNNTLTSVSLSENSIGSSIEALCDLLEHNTSLRTIDLSNNKLGAASSCQIIGEALATNKSITSINYSDNNMGHTEFTQLLQHLSGSTLLKELKIARNKIGTEGCKALGKFLETHSLTVLDIAEIKAEPDGFKQLFAGLKKTSQSLVRLNLSGNRQLFGSDRAKLICRFYARNNTPLRSLDLSDNGIYDPIDITKLIVENKSITDLDLSKNLISEEDLLTIMRRLTDNQSLTRLHTDMRHVSVRKTLEEILRKNKVRQQEKCIQIITIIHNIKRSILVQMLPLELWLYIFKFVDVPGMVQPNFETIAQQILEQ